MITTKINVDLIEVMQNDVVRVRVKTSVLSNDIQIAESFEHRVVAPGADYSSEDAKVKAVCSVVHTADSIAAYVAPQEVAQPA